MKLDIGCGLNLKKPLDEWTHLDCDEGPHIEYVCDFGDIPLEDESVSEIWIGDVVEHIPVWRQDEVMKEWYRILEPGGIIAGNTPNLEYTIRQYLNKEIEVDWLLQVFYGDRAGPPHQHYILFNKDLLDAFFRKYGFSPTDFSKSPGGGPRPWWLVFTTTKL